MSVEVVVILAGALVGLSYVISKRLAETRFHPATLTAAYSLVSALLILPFAFTTFKLPDTPFLWFLSIVSPLIFGLAFVFGFKAYQTVDASVVGLISRLSIVFAVLIGISFLGEAYTMKSFYGLALVLFGSLIVLYEGRQIIFQKGEFFALLMALGYGGVAVLDKKILEGFSPLTYVFFNNLLIVVVFHFFKSVRSETVSLLKTQTKLVIRSGLCGVAGWSLFLVTIQNEAVTKLYPIWESAALIVTVFAAVLWLKERTRLVQKFIGLIFTVVGIFLLAM